MKTSTSRILLAEDFPGMVSRPAGDQALAVVLLALDGSEVVELDFGRADPSPSFADQCVGGLVSRLGLEEFRRRVQLLNVPSHAVPLLRHVIFRKAAERTRAA